MMRETSAKRTTDESPLHGAVRSVASGEERRIHAEQIRTLYRHLPPIVATNIIVSGAMLYGLWGVVPHVGLCLWIAAMLIILACRLVAYIAYRRSRAPERVPRWATAFVVGSGLTGLMWGGAGVAFLTGGGLEYQLFILFILMGMGAGAVASLSTYLPAFYAFFPFSMLPSGIVLFLQDTPIHAALATMTFVYVIALCFFAHNINRSLVTSLSLRFTNLRLVEQLREQREEAVQANSAKTRFLAAASHDLRQPLHALTLFLSTLDQYIREPKARRVVDQINSSVNTLHTLFNALLDISRLEAGALPVEKIHFTLDTLFGQLFDAFYHEAAAKGLRLEFDSCQINVYTDPVLLEQILRNFVSNAIRYTETGTVRVSCLTSGENMRITVSDTGVGIAAENYQSIFREFHQLNNPERDRGKGLGLGLAIVERIAALLGHRIGLESVVGEGTVFWVDVTTGVATELEKSPQDGKRPDQPPVDNARILVIDDEADIRESTCLLLESWGCQVVAVQSAEEAMSELRRRQYIPDGVIADYRLRENRTGIEAIERIHRELSPDIPALIVTGDAAVAHLHEIRHSGLQVLYKPVSPLKLRTFVRNACKLRHSRLL